MDFTKKRKHGDTNAPVESLGTHIAVPSHDSAEMTRKLERLCDFLERQQVRLQETAGNVRKRERRGRNNANERYRSLAVAPAENPGVHSNPHPTLQPAYQPLEPTGMITRRVHRRVPLARRIRRPFNIHARAKKPARGSHRKVVITSGAAAPRSKTTGKRRRDSPRRRKRIVVGSMPYGHLPSRCHQRLRNLLTHRRFCASNSAASLRSWSMRCSTCTTPWYVRTQAAFGCTAAHLNNTWRSSCLTSRRIYSAK
jgi:hypothetical protein